MSHVPTQTYHSFYGADGGEQPIGDITRIEQRLSVLESRQLTMNSQLQQLDSYVNLLLTNTGANEFAFVAESYLLTSESGVWKLCAGYTFFDSKSVVSIRGRSTNWPDGSAWEILALRADGTRNNQVINSFEFDIVPSFNMSFGVGDSIAVLVRNFTPIPDATSDTTPAVCSIVMKGATL